MADCIKCFWHMETDSGTDYCCLIDMFLLSDEQCNGCPEFMENTDDANKTN